MGLKLDAQQNYKRPSSLILRLIWAIKKKFKTKCLGNKGHFR